MVCCFAYFRPLQRQKGHSLRHSTQVNDYIWLTSLNCVHGWWGFAILLYAYCYDLYFEIFPQWGAQIGNQCQLNSCWPDGRSTVLDYSVEKKIRMSNCLRLNFLEVAGKVEWLARFYCSPLISQKKLVLPIPFNLHSPQFFKCQDQMQLFNSTNYYSNWR